MDPITLGMFSLLVVRAFDLPGGFWFGLLPLPLTAVGVLQSLDVVDRTAHPGELLTGGEAINIVRMVAEMSQERSAGRDE